MSSVRVLVGTRKGAFILTGGWCAQTMESQRPAFCGLGNLSRKRFACRSEPDLCIANQRVVRPNHPTFR